MAMSILVARAQKRQRRVLFSVTLIISSVFLFLLLSVFTPLGARLAAAGERQMALETLRQLSSRPPLPPFPWCDLNATNFMPCQDPARAVLFPKTRNEFRERHCPPQGERLQCLIPSPAGYNPPPPWPQRKDEVWFVNIPHDKISVIKATEHWMERRDDVWHFPGSSSAAKEADAYIKRIGKHLDFKGGAIRTALDVGAGVGGFGTMLLPYEILTMSIAPKDSNRAQIQFALERGLPALVALMGTIRLPFPSRAYDLVHCADCQVAWTANNGTYLLEADRVLRPGAYFVLSGPPLGRRKRQNVEWEELERLSDRMCWRQVATMRDLVIWQKPRDHECQLARKRAKKPSICKAREDPDRAWNVKLRACISRMSPTLKGSQPELATWPERLNAPPTRLPSFTKSPQSPPMAPAGKANSKAVRSPRILPPVHIKEEKKGEKGNSLDGRNGKKDGADVAGGEKTGGDTLVENPDRRKLQQMEGERAKESEGNQGTGAEPQNSTRLQQQGFDAENRRWQRRVKHYRRLGLLQGSEPGMIRNVLDMTAGSGGFAAALENDALWVMNVVPVGTHNTLPAIFDRGLLGVYHDWCEAFSTYPRTYDLIHASGMRIFTGHVKRCRLVDVLLEMDRILRPGGSVIIRDTLNLVAKVKRVAVAMSWEVQILDASDSPKGRQKIIFARKPLAAAPSPQELPPKP